MPDDLSLNELLALYRTTLFEDASIPASVMMAAS